MPLTPLTVLFFFCPLLCLSFAISSQETNLQNFTIQLPAGTSNHGDAHLLCPPATWLQLAVFFIGNYFSHAATVKLPPAATILRTITLLTNALLMPASGLYLGLTAVHQSIQGYNLDDLQKAAIAGALCMYARADQWRPTGTIKVPFLLDDRAKNESASIASFCRRFLRFRTRKQKSKYALQRAYANLQATWIAYEMLGQTLDHSAIFKLLEEANEPHEPANATLLQNVQPLHGRDNDALSEQHMGLSGDANETATIQADRAATSPPEIGILEISDPKGYPHMVRVPRKTEVHGSRFHFAGYELVFVPRNARIEPLWLDNGQAPKEQRLAKSRNSAKALIAILQLFFSSVVLWRARGNQIDVYGYASFSLSVAPYVVMSAVNLVANLVMEEYPSLYLVQNSVMEETEQVHRIKHEGVVGRILEEAEQSVRTISANAEDIAVVTLSVEDDTVERATFTLMSADEAIVRAIVPKKVVSIRRYPRYHVRRFSRKIDLAVIALGFLLVLAPFAIVGASSKFRAQSSTLPQRIAMMLWLSTGQAIGMMTAFVMASIDRGSFKPTPGHKVRKRSPLLTDTLLHQLGLDYDRKSKQLFSIARKTVRAIKYYYLNVALILNIRNEDTNVQALIFSLPYMFYGAVAIWGFITVGNMLREYGNCIRVY